MAGSILVGRHYRVGDLGHTRRFGLILAGFILAIFALGPLGVANIGRVVLEQTASDGTRTVGLVLLPVVMVVLAGAGVAAGYFLIPLNAALQSESDPQKLGKTIAVQNLGDNLGMILAGLIVLGCARAGLSPSQVFLVLALLVVVVLAGLRIPGARPPAAIANSIKP